MSSTIDAELATLHARIAQLEEAKKIPPPPKRTIEELIADKRKAIEESYHRRNMSDVSKAAINNCRSDVEMLESILESLNRIHARLDALERK
jgi:hypothetical protein